MILETRLTALSEELELTRHELEESARAAAEDAAHRATLDAQDRIGALERALLGDTARDVASGSEASRRSPSGCCYRPSGGVLG